MTEHMTQYPAGCYMLLANVSVQTLQSSLNSI